MVEKQLKKVDNLDRENLLQYNTKKQNNRVPLVITYSKALPNIHEILKNFWGISCEKSRFYTKKSYFFQLRREARKLLGFFV
jgi:hypothetical protein